VGSITATGTITSASTVSIGGPAPLLFSRPTSGVGRVSQQTNWATFIGTADLGARRCTDIKSGFTGTWGTEYLAFHVGRGGQNDAALETLERMRIRGNGNVGIGTTNPNNQLHLFKASVDQSTGLFIEKQNAGSGSAQITFGVNSSNENIGVAKAGIFFQRTATAGRGDLKFCTNNIDNATNVGVADAALTIRSDGNVGIGKTNPGVALDVNGTVKANRFTTLVVEHSTFQAENTRSMGSVSYPGIYLFTLTSAGVTINNGGGSIFPRGVVHIIIDNNAVLLTEIVTAVGVGDFTFTGSAGTGTLSFKIGISPQTINQGGSTVSTSLTRFI
jgi:hypothetical protein